MHFVARVIDRSVNGAAEHRSAHHAFAQRDAAGHAVELDPHAGELDAIALPLGAVGDGALELRLVMDRKILHAQHALLHRIIRRRRFHRQRHLPAGHARVDVGEAKESAGVAAFQVDHLASAGSPAQIAGERRLAPDLGGQAETANLAGAARHLDVDTAQRLAVEADNGAEFHVEVDIHRLPFRGRARRSAAGRGLDEAAAVIDVAAHDHAQRSIRRAFGLEAGAVAVGKTVGREIGRLHLPGAVEIDGTP